MKNLVILDGYMVNPGDLSWEVLNSICNVTIYNNTNVNEIHERLKDANYVFTCKVPLRSDVISKFSKIEYIGAMATGFNHIDTQFCKENNIIVTNVPNYSSNSVAQHIFALLLEICNRVGHHNHLIQNGSWINTSYPSFYDGNLIELSSKTFGSIGYGNIGKSACSIASAFGMNVIATSQTKKCGVHDGVKFTDLEDLLKKSDVISLNCPLSNDTFGMINKNNINLMKDGVIIINTARGQLIVENDLADALKSGKVYGAGLDVLENEPMKEDCSLLGIDNCIITSHLAWCPLESRKRLIEGLFNNLNSYIEGRSLNIVSS